MPEKNTDLSVLLQNAHKITDFHVSMRKAPPIVGILLVVAGLLVSYLAYNHDGDAALAFQVAAVLSICYGVYLLWFLTAAGRRYQQRELTRQQEERLRGIAPEADALTAELAICAMDGRDRLQFIAAVSEMPLGVCEAERVGRSRLANRDDRKQ